MILSQTSIQRQIVTYTTVQTIAHKSDSSSFQTDSDCLPNLISQRQEYTVGTSITSVISHQSNITVPWDNYDQLGDVSYSLQYDQSDWYTDDNIDNEFESIISKKDLDMIAHTFYLRKKEMEEVSYPNPVEDETVFYDCHLEPEEIEHINVHHLEVFGKS